jgi:hypothetical protein
MIRSDLLGRAQAIVEKIDHCEDPLRCALYHREAADILPELIEALAPQRPR